MAVNPQHEQEKRWVALTSLLAAIGITGFKLVVGLLTGSLGIMAEAAHSGLDLVAAAATFWSIRVAGRPADREHPFGHGKVENLSALFQVVLLFVTCIWIFWEAVHRILPHEQAKLENIEITKWSFIVMFTSIAVDYSRSTALAKAARKHNSQALEADSLHFRTDIWSSGAVIIGLALVWLGMAENRSWVGTHVWGLAFLKELPLDFLKYADVFAAISVAVITVWVTWHLAIRTVLALMDTAPSGVDLQIKAAVEALPEIMDCHNVRVRTSGPQVFVDVHVWVDGNQTLAKTHDQMDVIELAICEILPNADVTVHPEPKGSA